MPVGSSDLAHLLSTSAGSTGGVISGSSIVSGVKNNVNPDVADADRIAGIILYRKTFFKNNHGTDSVIKPVIWYSVAPTNATLQLGLGFSSASDDDPACGNMTAFSGNAIPFVESDGADTRQVTVTGLDTAGTPAPISLTVTLTGTTPVSLVTSFSKVLGFRVSATSASRIVTLKQGSGGTVRGTIGLNKLVSWLWVSAGTAKASGLLLPDLPAGQNIGVWRKLTVSAGAGAVKPDTQSISFEEN